ncbi:MAG TPA: histidine kinase, partial [Ktedonobacterales bacterium]|nr:histidine kinase [Ktedonobacterales bacterium]
MPIAAASIRVRGMPRPRTWMVDLAVAVGFAAVTEYEIWIGPIPFLGGSAQGFRAGFALGVLLLSGALAVRRRWPVVGSGFVGAAALWAALFLRLEPGTSGNLFELFVAPLFMSYSTGANTTGRRTVAAALLMGVPLLINQVLHPPPLNLQQDASEWLFYGALFLAGKTLQRLRTRARNLAEARERDIDAAVSEERARIAREMHDVVAHGVSVMVLQAGAARQTLDTRPESAREALVAAETTGRETLSELRRLLEIL